MLSVHQRREGRRPRPAVRCRFGRTVSSNQFVEKTIRIACLLFLAAFARAGRNGGTWEGGPSVYVLCVFRPTESTVPTIFEKTFLVREVATVGYHFFQQSTMNEKQTSHNITSFMASLDPRGELSIDIGIGDIRTVIGDDTWGLLYKMLRLNS